MSPRFERFVAGLYVDVNARKRFLADPRAEATEAGLTSDEVAAAIRIDRVGLELAAASFAYKRQRQRRPIFVRLSESVSTRLQRWFAAHREPSADVSSK